MREFPPDRRYAPPAPDGNRGNPQPVNRGADDFQRPALPGGALLDNGQILPEGMMFPPSAPHSPSSSPPPPDPFPTAHDELGRAPQQQIFRTPPWEEQRGPAAGRLQRDMIDGGMEPWARPPGPALPRPAVSIPGRPSLPAAGPADAPRPPASSSQQSAASSMPAAARPEETRGGGRVGDPVANDRRGRPLDGMIDDLLLD